MRCNNCGWGNDKARVRCEKCNYQLAGSLNANQEANKSMPGGSNDFISNLSKTIPGEPSISPSWDTPNTGEIPVHEFTQTEDRPDPMNEEQEIKKEDRDIIINPSPDHKPISINKLNGTIDPSKLAKRNATFKLTPILREDESEEKELFFAEDYVELSRDNTDPDNMSITSKTQAIIELRDGTWYLLDRSKLKTTFRQVDEPAELKSGCIILLGDRKFIFEY